MNIFDRSAALRNAGDDPEILDQVLHMFLEQGPLRMAKVEDALVRGDIREAEREAHGLKGAAATLGMEALRAAAGVVEREAAAGRLEAAATAAREMRLALDAAVAVVAAALG